MKKGFAPILILLLVAVIGIAGFFAFKSGKLNSIVRVGTPVPSASSDPTANWKTYTNSQYHFQIMYPGDKYEQTTDSAWPNSIALFLKVPMQNGEGYSLAIQKWQTIDEFKKLYPNQSDYKVFNDPNGGIITLLNIAGVYEPQVDTMISTFKFTNQSQDDMSGWKTYTKNNFTFKYPSDFTLGENSDNSVYVTKYGPSQKPQADFVDGVNILFVPRILDNQTLEQWVDQSISQNTGMVTVTEGKKVVSLNGYSGFTYAVSGMGVQKNTILQSPFSKVNFMQITNATVDPTGQGYLNIATQILSTFKFTQ